MSSINAILGSNKQLEYEKTKEEMKMQQMRLLYDNSTTVGVPDGIANSSSGLYHPGSYTPAPTAPPYWSSIPFPAGPANTKVSEELLRQLHNRMTVAIMAGCSDEQVAKIYAENFKYIMEAIKKEQRELPF